MSPQQQSATQARSSVALLREPLLVGALGLGGAVLLRLRDPHTSGSYGFCPFLELTGLPCPGCGGLRAVNDLMHGDVVSALSSNLLGVVLIATLAALWVRWVVRRARGLDVPLAAIGARAGSAIIVAFVAFGILRNTPWGSWLAP